MGISIYCVCSKVLFKQIHKVLEIGKVTLDKNVLLYSEKGLDIGAYALSRHIQVIPV